MSVTVVEYDQYGHRDRVYPTAEWWSVSTDGLLDVYEKLEEDGAPANASRTVVTYAPGSWAKVTRGDTTQR